MANLLPRLPRVEALLGRTFAQFDAPDLDRMVATRVREDTDIEFKSGVYAESEKGHSDAASDVAAMANGPGGVIFLGIEDLDGAAAKVLPIPFSETTEQRIRQAIISRTAPAPQFVVHRVPVSAQDQGVYLIIVPRSPYAPHAVLYAPHAERSGSRLGYPKRAGPHTRWLSESEVADSYRTRFTTSQERSQHLDVVVAEARSRLSSERVWLAVAVVPAIPGSFVVRRRSMAQLREEAEKRWCLSTFARHVFWDYPRPEVAAGRVILLAGREPNTVGQPLINRFSVSGHAEGRSDGSVFAATPVGQLDRGLQGPPTALINDELLVESAIATVAFSAWFATERAGAVGDAYAAAYLIPGNGVRVEIRHARFGPNQPYDNANSMSGVMTSRAALNLDEAAAAQGQVIAARMLLTEVVQGFGLPEVYQITEEGKLRMPYIAQQNKQTVQHWANANGIELVDTTLDSEP